LNPQGVRRSRPRAVFCCLGPALNRFDAGSACPAAFARTTTGTRLHSIGVFHPRDGENDVASLWANPGLGWSCRGSAHAGLGQGGAGLGRSAGQSRCTECVRGLGPVLARRSPSATRAPDAICLGGSASGGDGRFAIRTRRAACGCGSQ
jgi:hypothetical protein